MVLPIKSVQWEMTMVWWDLVIVILSRARLSSSLARLLINHSRSSEARASPHGPSRPPTHRLHSVSCSFQHQQIFRSLVYTTFLSPTLNESFLVHTSSASSPIGTKPQGACIYVCIISMYRIYRVMEQMVCKAWLHVVHAHQKPLGVQIFGPRPLLLFLLAPPHSFLPPFPFFLLYFCSSFFWFFTLIFGTWTLFLFNKRFIRLDFSLFPSFFSRILLVIFSRSFSLTHTHALSFSFLYISIRYLSLLFQSEFPSTCKRTRRVQSATVTERKKERKAKGDTDQSR